MNSIIELKDVEFGYDNRILFNNVNLKIYKGDFIALLGANGTGKSTLVKLMLGQLRQLKGEISVYGLSPHSSSTQVGYLPQSNRQSLVAFPITAYEVVTLGLHKDMGYFKLPLRSMKNKIINALSMVDMDDKATYNFNTMSGGEQQRVMIAKALISDPQILILDEPTAGIDMKSKLILFEILKHLNKVHGITILVITHELESIDGYFNRVIKITDERILVEEDR